MLRSLPLMLEIFWCQSYGMNVEMACTAEPLFVTIARFYGGVLDLLAD